MAGPELEVTSSERTHRDAYMVEKRRPVGKKGSRAQIRKKHTGSAMKHALLIVMPSFDKKWKKRVQSPNATPQGVKVFGVPVRVQSPIWGRCSGGLFP